MNNQHNNKEYHQLQLEYHLSAYMHRLDQALKTLGNKILQIHYLDPIAELVLYLPQLGR